MKKIYFLFLLVSTLSGHNAIAREKPAPGKYDAPYPSHFHYRAAWLKLKWYYRMDWPKSTADMARKILAAAKTDHNDPQIIKAIMTIEKCNRALFTNSDSENIQLYKNEISAAGFPVKPILQNMLAGLYTAYVSSYNHKYSISNNVHMDTVTQRNADFQLWDQARFKKEIRTLVLASIAEKQMLQQVRIRDFLPILDTAAGSERYRPTLYDILVHSAIRHLDAISVTGFYTAIDSIKVLPFTDFIHWPLQKQPWFDSANTYLLTLCFYQELERFHESGKNYDALVNLDITRLKYIQYNTEDSAKATDCLKGLQALEHLADGQQAAALAGYQRALYYSNTKEGPTETGTNNDIALEICNSYISKFPKSAGGKNCLSLKNSILASGFTPTFPTYQLPGKPVKITLKFKNSDKLYYRVIVHTDKMIAWERKHYYMTKRLLRKYGKCPTLYAGQFHLPYHAGYNWHETELALPPLENGEYIVLVKRDSNFKQLKNTEYAEFTVSGLRPFFQENLPDKNARLYVVNAENGAPVPDADILLTFSKNYGRKDSVMQAKTNENGSIDINSFGFSLFDYLSYTIKKGNDKISSGGSIRYNSYYKRTDTNLSTHFFTDRAIYRPGQTVFYKGIVVKNNADNTWTTVVPNHETTVVFYDVNNTKLAWKTLTTNEFGSFTGSFTIPASTLNGSFSIENGIGSVRFSVEEYKRPKFELKFIPVHKQYRVNDSIKAEGYAVSYSGANVDRSKISYKVTAGSSYNSLFMKAGDTVTDENGHFIISFKARPYKNGVRYNYAAKEYEYHIEANITDFTGETHTVYMEVNAAASSLAVHIGMPDWVNSNEPVSLMPSVENNKNEPVNMKGTFKIEKLVEPEYPFWSRAAGNADTWIYPEDTFKRLFPYDPYKKDNEITRVEKTCFTLTATSNEPLQVDAAQMHSLAQGHYMATYTVTDSFGHITEASAEFKVYNPAETKTAINNLGYIIPVVTKNVEPGSTARFIWGSAVDARVHVLAEHEGVIVFEKIFEARNNQVQVDIPILESYRGGLKLIMFSWVQNHLVNETWYVDVPFKSKDLQISASIFHSTLEPGQKETWKLTIKGPAAAKVSAEMMATLYDASLDVMATPAWSFNFNPASINHLEIKNQIGESSSSFQGFIDLNNKYSPNTSQYYDGIYLYLGTISEPLYLNFGRYNASSKRRWRQINCPDNFGGGSGGSFAFNDSRRFNDVADRTETAITPEDGSDFSTFRGNVFMKMKKNADGYVSDKDNLGRIPYEPVTDDESGQRRNYATSDNIGAKDEMLKKLAQVSARKNLSELAFFFPQLKTNDSGAVEISFTMPEALTKWNFMALAHTKDVMTGLFSKYTVTQKQLMVQPNAPRFLREGDEINFAVKIMNVGDTKKQAMVSIELVNPDNGAGINALLMAGAMQPQSITLPAKGSAMVSWKLKIPLGMTGFVYRISAATEDQSDGEEGIIPVLPKRILITESMPIFIKGNQTKDFNFKNISNYQNAATLTPFSVTLEMTSNPAWYAVQALPYLMEFPHDCHEQIFNRFFANAVAQYILKKEPRIKEVFNSWNKPGSTALQSQLEKNQDLKNILIAETPWANDALDESKTRMRLGMLFNDSLTNKGMEDALNRLEQNQLKDGSWSWFPGMEGDRDITGYICSGIGRLQQMGVSNAYMDRLQAMGAKAFRYLEYQMNDDYIEMIKDGEPLDDDNMSEEIVTFLYARSFLNEPVALIYQPAFLYWKGQAAKYWQDLSLMEKAMLVSSFKRLGIDAPARKIMKSISEFALHSDEMGMYWKENAGGYRMHDQKIETQCMLIEAYSAMGKSSRDSVEELKIWLLKNKQTHQWPTTTATADAIYCLLLKGEDPLQSEKEVSINIGREYFNTKTGIAGAEAGMGYFSHVWKGNDIKPAMGTIKVAKKDNGIAWGAVHFQFFQDLDKVQNFSGPINIRKYVYVQDNTAQGSILKPVSANTTFKTGDLVTIKIEIRLDRDMEYIHLKDLRAGALEPIEYLSGYKYKAGLGYYQEIKDASMNFFFDHISKGTYNFEYSLRVSQNGTFQNGIASIENMYAPEFNSHTDGIIIRTGGK